MNQDVEATIRNIELHTAYESNKRQTSKYHSLLQTLYVNEVYELMHDPIRIITLPAGSEAGAISGVA